MRRFPRGSLAFLLLATLTGAAQAQISQSSGEANGDSRYTLKGTVVNAVTGEPVRRALVRSFSDPPREVLTDAEGYFEFSGLKAGQAAIRATKPGFFGDDSAGQLGIALSPVTAGIGPDSPPVTVKLVPESVIMGKVTSVGEPVEDIPVQAVVGRVRDGRMRWEPVGSVTTDEEGEFRIAGLTEGTYYLEVGPSSHPGVASAKSRETGYGTVFFPSAPEEGAGMPVAAGQHVEVPVTLTAEVLCRISGTLLMPPGASGTDIALFDAFGRRVATTPFNPDRGGFAVSAPPGTYSLQARVFGAGNVIATAILPLNLHADVTGLRLAPATLPVIPVHLKIEAVTAQGQRAQLQAERQPGGSVPVSIFFSRSGFSAFAPPPIMSADSSGKLETLAIRNLQPGTYWAQMSVARPWYFQSAQCGDVDLLRDELTVGTDAPCSEIEVVLRDDSASLAVNASWEGDATQATVVIVPERTPRLARAVPLTSHNLVVSQASSQPLQFVSGGQVYDLSNSVSSAPNGPLELNDLPPGQYRVLLFDNVSGLEYANPEAMSGYMSKAAQVTLEPGQKASVSVDLIHAGK